MATITLQNYFRMYDKLAGMTGTAYTEANEFHHIYKLDVMVMPTNKGLARFNYSDRIYKTKKGKFNAVINEIEENYKKKQPMLVGTASIHDSEELSFLLNKKGVAHNVLNAKYHEKEAMIVSQAGALAQITIATNMAGRGTDIILGGNIDYFIKDLLAKNKITSADPVYKEEYEKLYEKHKDKFEAEHNKVVELGGLHVIGTQRHEARRIDNQLRGRSGRQGDPGSGRFYISLEDDLMRFFGPEKIHFLMEKFGFPEDEPIEHGLITRSMEIAQKRVEAHNFEIRKQLLDYDNVMNKQREVIYGQRRKILESESIKEEIFDMVDAVIEGKVPQYFAEEEKNTLGLVHWIKATFGMDIPAQTLSELGLEETKSFLKDEVKKFYEEKEKKSDPAMMRQMEKAIALWVVDARWKENLLIMDSLREGIHLRSYAQTDPLVEYQKESYNAFDDMVASIKEGIVDMIFKTKVQAPEKRVSVFEEAGQNFVHSEYSSLEHPPQGTGAQSPDKPAEKAAPRKVDKKIGRNDPCPCGSGKKFKKCCGQ